jgi:nucleolar protein 56
MKVFVIKTPLGFFVFDENKELIKYRFFKDVAEAVEGQKKTPEDILESFGGYEVRTHSPEIEKHLKQNFRKYVLELKSSKEEELNTFLSEFYVAWSRKRMTSLMTKDRILIQAYNALEDLNKTINLFSERLSEWYGLHYPEFKANPKQLAEKIQEFGSRENFPDFEQSTGVEISQEDEVILKEYASLLLRLFEQKKNLEKYLQDSMKELMPNFSAVIDPVLACKMLSLAGSLEKLAKMSSSTIQLLGAEKALFRHLHKKGKSPKYGVLFLSKEIQNAPIDKRGKIARVLASKLMIAARIDFYSKRDESEKIKEQLKKELEKVLA